MRISVACCTYNGAAFLREQLDSLLRQTVRPDEIVIVDDRSNDDSVAIANGFAADAGDVRVVVSTNASNLGIVANFERAISLTSGDVIFLCDQDDVWHPSKIETLRDRFVARPDLAFVFGDARLVDAVGRPLPASLFVALEMGRRERTLVRDGRAYEALLGRNLATGATSALRRSLFERARPFPSEWIHDEWLAIVAAATGAIDFVDAPLVDYRQHGGNQIGMRRLSFAEKVVKLFRPRADRYARIALRTDVLIAKLRSLGPLVPAGRLDDAEEKLAHARVRARLPAFRPARLVPVAREAMTGRYARFSSGVQGIVRDCTEPA